MRYLLAALLVLFSGAAFAADKPDNKAINDVVDVANGLPITIDDAGTQEYGTWSSQFATHYLRNVDGKNSLFIDPELQYGLMKNVEISVDMPYTLEMIDGSHGDNVTATVKYNFLEEGDGIPALTIQEAFGLPTADDAAGTDLTTSFLLTKHILPHYGVTAVYFNANWTRFGAIDSDERRNAYSTAAGFSHAIAARTSLVADLAEQNEEDKGRSDTLAEIGLRQGINKDLILSFGGGVGLNKDAPDYTATIGVEYGF
jgi:hypothetical protein